MKKKILITGGTGFLGFNFIKSLNQKKYDITSLSSKKKSKKNFIKGVKYVFCDISNFKKLKKKIGKQYSFIVNFSGNIDHKNKSETFRVHYQGLKNLVKLIDKKHLELFIQIGSSLEYGKLKSPQKENLVCRPVSYYGRAKYLSSRYILKKLNRFLILRLYQVYGPYQKNDRLIPYVIKSCLRNKEFSCTEGLQIRDFLFVDDLVNLLSKIINKKKMHYSVYNVGSGKPLKVKKLINLIVKKIKNGKPKFGKIKMRKEETKNLFPNTRSVQKDFKWRPKVSISQGLQKTINHYAKN